MWDVCERLRAEQLGANRGGDEAPCAAVLKDVHNLSRFKDGIDRYKDAARGNCPEHRDHGFNAFVEEDRDTLADGGVECTQLLTKPAAERGECAVGQARTIHDERFGLGCAVRCRLHQFHDVVHFRTIDQECRMNDVRIQCLFFASRLSGAPPWRRSIRQGHSITARSVRLPLCLRSREN